MKGKILFAAGAAAGYVLGSKAGRQAYEQIRGKAQDLWGDPHVQKAVSQAGQVAKDAATVAQAKISGAAKEATSGSGTSSDSSPSSDSGTSGTTGTSGNTTSGSWTDVSADALSEVQDADVETKQDEPGDLSTPDTFGAPGGTPNPV
jgi:hypothetical protein